MTSIALAFIGAGNMAEAIARGILRSALFRTNELRAADPSPQRRALFESGLRIACVENPADAVPGAATVLLAVKPQAMASALEQCKPALPKDALVITIAAGITTSYIENALNPGTRVVRVMPNTPMLVGAGMSGICPGAAATPDDLRLAEQIFGSAGLTVRVKEDRMNAITAVSGSGPAYLFYLTEALAAAGEKLGFSASEALLLARQTVIGAAKLLEESKDSPSDLRTKVTSPGGTTQAALESLRAADFMGIMAQAITAAEARGRDLAK
jgi:pyrroline-5-carboxylate reductase